MPRGRRRAAAPPAEDYGPSSDDDDDGAAPREEEGRGDYDGAMDDRDGAMDDGAASDGAAHDAAGEGGEEDGDVLRVLLSTDNHVGYLERDPVRGRDSFAALEEVLSLARHHRADMVLLGGDLFHDNKPSRKTLHSTMEILRRYCMGGDPVGFQIVSDQSQCLRSVVSGRANYEDEFYSVDLPIFTIHGNHDDPTRDGGPDLLSAVDLLSVANLVNYFGRQDEVDNVKVSPILLQKGETKVALYGMGSMRDERLNRMWQGKKVKFLRPDQADGDDGEAEESGWFNIFTLHQNRDLGRGSKNCVHESMIPEWMDLVVWGHEHECNITPQESLVGTFRITQPGSSVATTLTLGESRRKHVGLLEIRGQQFRLKEIPLASVRSFAVGEISLEAKARENGGVLDAEDPKVEERISDVLAAEVDDLIQKARDEAEHLRQDAEAEAQRSRALEDEFGDPESRRERKYRIKDPDRVLVRLKVEHSGFATLNNQRFGAQFVGQVANPSDILLFHKRRKAESAKGGKVGASKKKRGAAGLDVPIEPEDLAEVNIEDLVADNLVNNDKKLELLDERSMGQALEQFVDKKNIHAIAETAEGILTENQKILIKRGKDGGEDGDAAVDNPTSIREFLGAMTDRKRADFELEREDKEAEAADEDDNGKSTKKGRGKSKTSTARKRANSEDDESLGESEEEERPTKKKSRAATTSKKAAAKPRRKYDDDDDDDEDDDFVDMDDSPPPPKKRATARKATASKATARKTTTTKARSRPTDDSDSEIEFMGSSQATSQPSARSSRAARTARTTAKKPKYNYDDSEVEEIEDPDDDVAEETPRPKAARGGRGKGVTSAGTGRARASSQRTQSTLSSFNYARRPATAVRGRSTRKKYDSDSDDDEPSSSFGGGGAWGSASQSTKRRGRR